MEKQWPATEENLADSNSPAKVAVEQAAAGSAWGEEFDKQGVNGLNDTNQEDVESAAGAVNRRPLLLVTLFLGGAGGHKIYLKKYSLAALYLLFFWTGIPSLVALGEFFGYAVKSDEQFAEKYPPAETKALYCSIAIPISGIILYVIIFAVAVAVAAPRLSSLWSPATVEDYNAAALTDAKNCRVALEGYYAEKRRYPKSLRTLKAVGCNASEGVSLFILAEKNHYVVVGLHKAGDKAYLQSRNATVGQELDKGDAVAELNSAFEILAEGDGLTVISQ